MEQAESEIILTENQELITGTDDLGRTVFLVVDKTLDKSGQQGTTGLIYDIVDQQRSYDEFGTSTALDTDTQLSASVSLDTRGTVYQYTVPVSSMENYTLPLGEGENNMIAEKVRVERVDQLPVNNLTNVISTDILNSTTADIILASSEESDINDSSTVQVQTCSSQDYGSIMSLPFLPSNVLSNNHTLSIPSSMEDAQLLNNFSADALESLQSLLDVDVDTTITTTTEELIDSALDPTPKATTINHENYNSSFQRDTNQRNKKAAQHPCQSSSSISKNQGDVRRSKRISSLAPKNYYLDYKPQYQHEEVNSVSVKEKAAKAKREENKIARELANAEFMNPEDADMVKKCVSDFQPDLSSYPRLCRCSDYEKGRDIPVEQIWLHKDQMYYLPQINILVISFEEYVGFLRQDKWYVSVGEITQRLIPNFRNEVDLYLIKNVCDKQFLSLEEIEYLKQRKCVNQNTKSGTMISLETLREMCKYLASTKAFIQAPTTGLSNAAYGQFYKKLLGKKARCSKCGGATTNVEDSIKYILLDSPAEVIYSRKIEQNAPVSQGAAQQQKLMYVGEVVIENERFKSFKLDEMTYISLKEIVELQVFNLQVLQSRLVQLQYRPRPAPTAIDLHFSSECRNHDVNQTLWIDLMTLRCACCMSRQRSPVSRNEVLQQMFSRGQYTCTFELEIVAFDDYDSANNETVYTLDPHSYKITTSHNYNQLVPAGTGRKGQQSMSNEEHKRGETSRIVKKSHISSMKSKSRSNKITIRRTSPHKNVVERSHTEEVVSLKPGVYYFPDKNSIVDFLKKKNVDETVREDRNCEVKSSNVPVPSKPVFRLKSAPDAAPHLIRSGFPTSQKKTKQEKTAVPGTGCKRKLQEMETDSYCNNEVGCGVTRDFTYCDNRKENDVSSSMQGYQDIQTVAQISSQLDTYDYSSSGSHGLVKSPEVQDKNVDSTAANNVEEMDYTHSHEGKNCSPSSAISIPQDVEFRSTEGENKALYKMDTVEETCGCNSPDDLSEFEDDISKSNLDRRAHNLNLVRTTVHENSKFLSPCQSNKFDKNQGSSSPTSQSVSLSPVKPIECDADVPSDEIMRPDLLSPGYGGVFSTPTVSPILDRTGNTHKIERLYNKCASLDNSTDADKSLHVLATVATDLETLDENSQLNTSDRNQESVVNSVVSCELDKEKSAGVGVKKTTRRENIVLFLGQLLDNVAISRDSPSKKCVTVKFKEAAKKHFPALWKESGQTRLKKLVNLLALNVPPSSVEDVALKNLK